MTPHHTTEQANDALDNLTEEQYAEAQRLAELDGCPGPTACAEEDPDYAIELAARARAAVPEEGIA